MNLNKPEIQVNRNGGKLAILRDDLVVIANRDRYDDFLRINQRYTSDVYNFSSIFITREEILAIAELIQNGEI